MRLPEDFVIRYLLIPDIGRCIFVKYIYFIPNKLMWPEKGSFFVHMNSLVSIIPVCNVLYVFSLPRFSFTEVKLLLNS